MLVAHPSRSLTSCPSFRLAEYPSFISLVAPSANAPPSAPTSQLDPSTNDARLRIAATKATADAAKALRKKERERNAWRAAKGLPPLTEEDKKRLEGDSEINYLVLGGALLALLVLMAVMAGAVGGLVWYVSTRD